MELGNKHKWSTVTTVGFALFAMFFGAGNLILPPFIGLEVGNEWLWALLGFFITAIIAPFLGVLMVAKAGTNFTHLGNRIHPELIKWLTLFVILCIGPLIAIPRTGSTTFEVGIAPLLPDLPKIAFLAVFFGVVLVLSISKSKIVDIIGKFLTPFLLIVLVLLIVLGILFPLHHTLPSDFVAKDSFVFGFTEGYQTMDVLASVIFAGIIISAVGEKGYRSPEKRSHITLLSGSISTICLLFIYGGLIYLGATSGYLTDNEVSRTDLLLYISHSVLGRWGAMAVALAMGLACLTTAIALTSSVGSFFEELTKGRLPYKAGVILCTLVSIVLSINKVDSIIQYAAYILLFLYPIVFTIILDVLLFGNTVKSRTPYLVSIAVTAVLSFIDSCKTWGVSSLEQVYALKAYLPLDSYSLGWLLPSLLAFLGAAVLKRRGKR